MHNLLVPPVPLLQEETWVEAIVSAPLQSDRLDCLSVRTSLLSKTTRLDGGDPHG